jgi:hypothetical protein
MGNQRSRYDRFNGFVALDKPPLRNRSTRAAKPKALMVAQVLRPLRRSSLLKIPWARNHREWEWRGQPDGNHVRCNELSEPDAGVETANGKVDHFIAGSNFQLNLRISFAERGEHGLQDKWNYTSRHGEAQEAGRSLAQVPSGLSRCQEFIKSRAGTLNESLPSFGQSDTAGGAEEQGRTDARFQSANRLTYSGWRDTEFIRSAPETLQSCS